MMKVEEYQNIMSLLEAAAKQDEKVLVVLESGKEYSGKAKKINDSSFSIREISGKEFYDAIIRVDKIVAVEVKAR